MEGSASDNNYDDNYDDNYDKNNYFKFLNSIIHKSEFKSEYNSEEDSGEENEQYIYFNQPSQYKYEDDIPTIIVDQVSKKDKPKSNFYKYLFGSVLIVTTSVITVSYFFSKKRNKNKN